MNRLLLALGATSLLATCVALASAAMVVQTAERTPITENAAAQANREAGPSADPAAARKCGDCGGSGSISCGWCGGDGIRGEKQCGFCTGKGEISCVKCGGDGQTFVR